jgi:hypothetical protein
MSNLERQRRFRKSHPGYFRKYHRRIKSTPPPVGVPAGPQVMVVSAHKPEPLMLPAPVEELHFPAFDTATSAMPELADSGQHMC